MQNKNGFQANFGGNIIFGIPGKDGGYYLVNAEQINANTLRLTFIPSQDGMALVDPVNINLPGATDEQIREIVLEYLKDNPAIGKPGEDGFSPIAKVTQTDDGAVITIADKNGTTEVTITNGKDGNDGKDGTDGKDGEPGKNGADGVTPTFSIGTVETLAAGRDATASISGTKEKPVLNLGIPQGLPGEGGAGGKFRLFKTIVVPETAADGADGVAWLDAKNGGVLFAFDTDDEGNPFSMNDLFIYSEIRGYEEGCTVPVLTLGNTPGYGNWGIFFAVDMFVNSYGKNTAMITKVDINKWSTIMTKADGAGYQGAIMTNNVASPVQNASGEMSFTSIKVVLPYKPDFGFYPGSKFYFYGR